MYHPLTRPIFQRLNCWSGLTSSLLRNRTWVDRQVTDHPGSVGPTGPGVLSVAGLCASDRRPVCCRWALRVSNPRPSPCKGEPNVLVRGLSSENDVPVSPSQYLGVEPARDADVMQAVVGRVHRCLVALYSNLGEMQPLQEQGVHGDEEARARHRQGGDLRSKHEAERGDKHACRYR